MLKGFSKGGIHTPEYKISKAEAIADFPLPEIAVVPLSQHIGAPAAACVKKGGTDTQPEPHLPEMRKRDPAQ